MQGCSFQMTIGLKLHTMFSFRLPTSSKQCIYVIDSCSRRLRYAISAFRDCCPIWRRKVHSRSERASEANSRMLVCWEDEHRAKIISHG
jgi:hypothetical protein